MSEAPERIYAAPPSDDREWKSGAGEWDASRYWTADGATEYIRADLAGPEGQRGKTRPSFPRLNGAIGAWARKAEPRDAVVYHTDTFARGRVCAEAMRLFEEGLVLLTRRRLTKEGVFEYIAHRTSR